MKQEKQTARWYEQPCGNLMHGMAVERVYVVQHEHNNMYGWHAGIGLHSEKDFETRDEAVKNAEESMRKRLSEAVELMGGHVVWSTGGCS